MRAILIISLLIGGVMGHLPSTLAVKLEADEVDEVYKLLQHPADSSLQRDIKLIVAKYLVENTFLSDDGSDLSGRLDEPIPFGRHKHHDRYNELLQKLQEQEKRLQEMNKATAAVPVSNPINSPPVQSLPPSVSVVSIPQDQQAKQEAVVSVTPTTPGVIPSPLLPSPEQKLPETVTQIPIIVQATPAAVPVPPQGTQETLTTTVIPVTIHPTVDPVHHLNQVNKILGNVANGNIVGIVDESLAIRAPPPVRQLVTNIMKVIFCNPINRLFGRCAPNQIDAAKNSAKGK